jgi:hypothetical protein
VREDHHVIPTDETGSAYRGALDSYAMAIEHEVKIAHALERAKVEVSNKREQLNTAVIRMLEKARKQTLGPDGGK